MKQLFPLLLLLFSTTLLAETAATDLPEYDVEVIIFEDAHARYLNSEDWRHENMTENSTEAAPEEAVTENLDNLSLDEINATTFKSIKPAILAREYKRINDSSEYNVLLYAAWRQAGLKEEKAFEISLEELSNNHQAVSESSITGTLKLVLARYLHIFGKLAYHRPGEIPRDDTTTEETGVAGTTEPLVEETTYPIEFRRRMRSKELHYIDHPLVGILIQVNPVKKPETAE